MSARARRAWLVGLVVLALVAQLALSFGAVRLERGAARARAVREQELAVDAALWRLDAALTHLLAAESARPAVHFESLYAEPLATDVEGAVLVPTGDGDAQTGLVASPLLRRPSAFFRLHFESTDRGYRSPQLPLPSLVERMIEGGWTTSESVQQAADQLELLRLGLPGSTLVRALSAPLRPTRAGAVPNDLYERLASLYQASRRGVTPATGVVADPPQAFVPYLHPEGLDPAEPERAFELFLLRFARAGDGRIVQGVWLDWPHVERWLLTQIESLVPAGVALRPVLPGEESLRGRLASLPVRLVVPLVQSPRASVATPVRLAIGLAWLMLLAALLALWLALRTAVQLSERRGRFVAGVSHELRTPLTTFCLYSEMLADGLVKGEDDRQEYLDALKSESQRLRRVVDNVLTYAQLEGRRSEVRAERVTCGALLERSRPGLERRAREAGLAFTWLGADDDLSARELETDPQAVEQVLTNLVDNAAKYAGRGSRLEVGARSASSSGVAEHLVVTVADDGPGLPPDVRSRAFDAFRRGARHADGETGGLGLGLHLARALAEMAGGELVLDPEAERGASFSLRLPLLAPQRS